MEIEPSKKEKFYHNTSLILCIVLYFILRIKRRATELSSLLILIGLFTTIYLQCKNQKLCEKGILDATGLVEWKNIESIDPVDEMTDKIKIHKREKVNGARKITLYCIPGEALNIVHLIEQNRMRENDIFQNERYLQK